MTLGLSAGAIAAIAGGALGAAGSIGGALISADGQKSAGKVNFDSDPNDFFLFPASANRVRENLIEPFIGGRAGKALRDFIFKPVPLTAGEQFAGNFFSPSGGFLPLVNEAEGLIRSELFPVASEALQTGFRTDIDPIVQAELHRLRTDTGPSLAARFGGALSGSGFEQALGQSAEDLGIYLGSQQVGLDEAAAGRRLQALLSGRPQEIFLSPLTLQSTAAETVGDAGEEFRRRQESVRPGGRLLAGLPTIANTAATFGVFPGTVVSGGNNPSNPNAGLLSALGEAAPSIASSLGQLFQSSGGSGTAGSTFSTASQLGFDVNPIFTQPLNLSTGFNDTGTNTFSSGFDFFSP